MLVLSCFLIQILFTLLYDKIICNQAWNPTISSAKAVFDGLIKLCNASKVSQLIEDVAKLQSMVESMGDAQQGMASSIHEMLSETESIGVSLKKPSALMSIAGQGDGEASLTSHPALHPFPVSHSHASSIPFEKEEENMIDGYHGGRSYRYG